MLASELKASESVKPPGIFMRYRGLAKNTARLYTAFALANLYMLRRRLIGPQGTCQW